MAKPPVEQFAALSGLPGIVHAFTQRVPGLDVQADRAVALQRLDEHHAAVRLQLGLASKTLITAVQVHGNSVALVDSGTAVPVADADGLVTADPAACLGIYVADCCAVYIVDPKTPAIGLVHSGRKGTELGVVTNAIKQMIEPFGSDPANIIVQLSPCIRPPHYEVDFAAEIIRQCRALGVQHINDPGSCTACDLGRYYSYRAEKGKTGRMLAVLGLNPTIAN